MAVLALVGRIILGLFFVESGWHHLRDLKTLTPFTAQKGIPAPGFAVVFTGLMLLYGGLVTLAGTLWASGLIVAAIALLGFSVGLHNFWADEDPGARQMNRMQFGKNLAILGGALALLTTTPTVWSLHL